MAVATRTASQTSRSAPGETSLHPGAWLVWLVCASAAVVLTSNPLYLSLAFLGAGGVYLSVRPTAKGRALQPFVIIGVLLASLTLPLNVLTGSSGSTVLATLPEVRSPDWFGGVIFGGRLTAEALVAATGRALSIATLVLVAAAFNASVDHFRLIKLAPRSLSRVMLVLTIALLVVPQALAHGRAVAEAHRLRGRRIRGVRAAGRLLLPTLQGALERSVQRAESMDARGFAGGVSGSDDRAGSLAGVAGLGLCAWGAFAHFYYGAGLMPAILLVAGCVLVGVTLLRAGAAHSSRYRRESWAARDAGVIALALLSVATVLTMRIAGTGDAAYLVYPEVAAPAFHPLGALAFALLLTPGLLSPPAVEAAT